MASFIVQSRQTVPANHAGSLSLTLAGTGTTWKSVPATFTLSGVTGVVKLGQIVTSDTLADVQITTGPNTGTLTISDGTNTATVKVAKIPRSKRWFPGL